MSAPLLAARGLVAGYGPLTILHGIDLEVAAGSVTALVGANGAGKTTIMRVLAGLLPLRGGSLRLHGGEVGGQDAHERVEAGVALVPEGRLVFPNLSVAQNLRLGAIAPRARAGAAERLQQVYRRFPRLLERRGQAAATLSGGEQQMLAIGRGLMMKPDLLLLDEPTLGLAPIMVRELFRIVRELREDGYTLLLAEQNVHLALEVADQAYVIENGRIAATGAGAALAETPEGRRAFLGL